MVSKVTLIEMDCREVIDSIKAELKDTKWRFDKYDNSEDMYLIDQLEMSLEYMQDMLKTIQSYK